MTFARRQGKNVVSTATAGMIESARSFSRSTCGSSEKVSFPCWLLTERIGKRADAERAEEDFAELIKEAGNVTSSSSWAEVKKQLAADPRYDAVGSSSLREELFNTFKSKLAATSSTNETSEEVAARRLQEKKAKQEASLREREAKVKEDQEAVQKEQARSRAGAGREEAERLFGSLLVDTIREPSVRASSCGTA